MLTLSAVVTAIGGAIVAVAALVRFPTAVLGIGAVMFVLGAVLAGLLSVWQAREADLTVPAVLARAGRRALGWFVAWLP